MSIARTVASASLWALFGSRDFSFGNAPGSVHTAFTMSATPPTILARARFNPKLKLYLLMTGVVMLTVTLVGLPLLPFWLIFGWALVSRSFARLEAELTPRALIVRRGIFIRSEKTIPLDKVQDLGVVDGPLLRIFGLEKLRVETAGQSSPNAADADLTGIIDARGFRDQVLTRRDELTDREVSKPADGGPDETLTVLREIRDALQRMEKTLTEKKPR